MPKTEKAEEAKAEKKPTIPELLKQLENSDDPAEKRNIRARLRSQGHVGGLNKPKVAPTPKGKAKKEEAPAPKKGNRARAAKPIGTAA